MNLTFSHEALTAVLKSGVRDFCLCAGARNSPILQILYEAEGVRTYSFFDERAAGFFALGIAKRTGKPAAVVTTSGTAAAELFPSVIEAHYTGLPLLLITADRPRSYRGTGAPQTIEQEGLFGKYVSDCLDLEAGEPTGAFKRIEAWDQKIPFHLNLRFGGVLIDENTPRLSLLDAPTAERRAGEASGGEAQNAKLIKFLSECKLPIVVVGELKESEKESVCKFLVRAGLPVYLEAPSGLREESRLSGLCLRHMDGLVRRFPKIDGILRIGGVPTTRLWRDIDEFPRNLKVLSLSSLPFSGSPSSDLIQCDLDSFLSEVLNPPHFSASLFQDLFVRDSALIRDLGQLFESEPQAEVSLFHKLSERIPFFSRIFLGNSLPIREWDLGASFRDRGFRLGVNRGANGIDGQLSTFLGWSDSERENWGIFGDLTTLYDLSGPWAVNQLSRRILRLVVVNNGGGKIFERMFKNPGYQTGHSVGFKSFAEIWNLPYLKFDHIPSEIELPEKCVIEITPDAEASRRFWQKYETLCSE
jgi:2-succinyl-5-enolpyruvyl-6-hydroxy-3-cyclohexene-1-carboxylate synthase